MSGCREACSVFGFHVFDCPTRDNQRQGICCDVCPMAPTCDEMTALTPEEREFILSGGDLFGGDA